MAGSMDDFDVSEGTVVLLEADVDGRVPGDDRNLQGAAAKLRSEAIPDALERRSRFVAVRLGPGTGSRPARRWSRDRGRPRCCRAGRCLPGDRGSTRGYAASPTGEGCSATGLAGVASLVTLRASMGLAPANAIPIGSLRRSELAPHRRVPGTLAHDELPTGPLHGSRARRSPSAPRTTDAKRSTCALGLQVALRDDLGTQAEGERRVEGDFDQEVIDDYQHAVRQASIPAGKTATRTAAAKRTDFGLSRLIRKPWRNACRAGSTRASTGAEASFQILHAR